MKELRSKAHALKPTVQIGKQGLTPELIKELKNQLKTRKLVKIKVMKSISDKKQEFLDIMLTETKAKLVQKVGNVIVLFKA